jgi:acylphosphatase
MFNIYYLKLFNTFGVWKTVDFMKHLNITIKGKVQAVGFRFYAMQMAYRYGVFGIVKNLSPDTVYIEAEATQDVLEPFVAWSRRGPVGARIESVEVAEAPLKNYSSFEIIHRNSDN